jgi:polyhydroxyalkanoate synthesis regulator phasin
MAKKVIEGLIGRGQELLGTVSEKLMEKPAVQQAFVAALEQKGKVDAAIGTGLKRMNVATRADLRALRLRVEALEAAIEELKAAVAATAATAAKKPASRRSSRLRAAR